MAQDTPTSSDELTPKSSIRELLLLVQEEAGGPHRIGLTARTLEDASVRTVKALTKRLDRVAAGGVIETLCKIPGVRARRANLIVLALTRSPGIAAGLQLPVPELDAGQEEAAGDQRAVLDLAKERPSADAFVDPGRPPKKAAAKAGRPSREAGPEAASSAAEANPAAAAEQRPSEVTPAMPDVRRGSLAEVLDGLTVWRDGQPRHVVVTNVADLTPERIAEFIDGLTGRVRYITRAVADRYSEEPDSDAAEALREDMSFAREVLTVLRAWRKRHPGSAGS